MLSNTAYPIEYGKFREQVMRGEIQVNEFISLEMNRIDFLIESPDYYYDDLAIEGFVEFCETELTLTDGSPVILLPSFRLWAEQLLAWFYFIEEKVWDPEQRRYIYVKTKKRLVNKQYLIVARGAAKSMYASFIQAYHLYIDLERTHQVVTAPTMIQANETTSPIATAITTARGPFMKFMTKGELKSNRALKKVKTASTKKGIENFMTNSIIEIRPMRIDRLQGLRSKVNTVDEWLSGDIKEDVVGALEQGASKTKDYIILCTSSEGTVRNSVGDSIKMELHKILRGEVFNPHVSIFHYKLDDISEIRDPNTWIKANPNLGATIGYDVYEKAVHRAETHPPARNDILAKWFGIPVEGYTYFFTYEETKTHRPQNFDGLECSLGIDLSQGDDFCAFTFIFDLGNERYGIKTRSYVSEHKYRKLNSALKEKYDQFEREDTLVIMDSKILDMNKVYEDLMEFVYKHDYTIYGVGYDPYNAKEFIERYGAEQGAFGLFKVIQGAKTESVPLGELKNLAESRSLIFDEELMKFTMGNAVAIQDNNGNYKLSKKRNEEKIDNVSALLCAWIAHKRINVEVY